MKNYHSPQLYVDGKHVVNPDYIAGCDGTRLIQRLKMPVANDDGAWCFGGGPAHGGLSKEGWGLVSPLCCFDYMGASEFEMGAIPQAFGKISKSRPDLEAYMMTISGAPEFLRSDKLRKYEHRPLEEIRRNHILYATVFVLSPKAIRPHVDEVIRSLALGEEDFLKERSCVREARFFSPLWADSEEDEWYHSIPQGWLELNNGFMFFANEEMWRGFCELFGVSVPGVCDIQPMQTDFSAVNKALESCSKRATVTV